MLPRFIRVLLSAAIAALALICQPVAAQSNAPPRLALVIGNGEYQSITSLSNPINDAKLIRDTLESLGFEVIYRENSDRASMERAVSAFSQRLYQAGPTATGLFYYAGHAVQSNGENYLLPSDIEARRESDLRFGAVRTSDVLAQMESSGINNKIVILDACRTNPFMRTFASNQVGGLSQIGLGNSEFFVAFAATAGNIAEDGNDDHSPYALALAKFLPTANSEISNTFRLIRNEVSAITNQQQLPETRSTLRQQFFFSGTGNGQPDSVTPLLNPEEPKDQVAVTVDALLGRWCTPGRSMGMEISISRDKLRYKLGRDATVFDIRSIRLADDNSILLEWDKSGETVVFEFGDFSSSGKLMTQLRGKTGNENEWQDYNLRLRRCG